MGDNVSATQGAPREQGFGIEARRAILNRMQPGNPSKVVVIVGASDNPARYSYMAMKMLGDYGHQVRLISPRLKAIEGHEVWPSLTALAIASPNSTIDTITMYVGAPISSNMTDQLLALSPKRIIFNPGAENSVIYESLYSAGIQPVEACTLVLLRTGQF